MRLYTHSSLAGRGGGEVNTFRQDYIQTTVGSRETSPKILSLNKCILRGLISFG